MADYKTHYARMTDGELLRLEAQKGDLVPEAKVALEEEIANRNLSTEQERDSSTLEEERAGNTQSRGSGLGRAALEVFIFFVISFLLAALVSQFEVPDNTAQQALGELSVSFAILLWLVYRTLAGFRYREILVAAVGITLLAVFLGPLLKKHYDRKAQRLKLQKIAVVNEWSRDLAGFTKPGRR